MDFPINKLNTVSDALWLYRGLGSFWTQLFDERETLKGYTKGQAEEITQRYLELIEAIDNYSVNKSHVYKRVKWKPIYLYKSKINEIPFIFEPADAVFGSQPSTSTYYAGVTFAFGNSKVPTAKVYQHAVGKELVDFGVIADKVIAPDLLLIRGADVIIDKGNLVFNRNIFEDASIAKTSVFDDAGNLVTFKDRNGKTQEEQLVILWAYEGKVDKDELYNNFGYIFSYRNTSSEKYKQILTKLVALYSQGPTVNAIKRLIGVFADVPYILESEETFESSFEADNRTYIVTDKNVYKLKKGLTSIKLTTGQKLTAGTFLATNLLFVDNQSSTTPWWKRNLLTKEQLALSNHLFLGNYKYQLAFSSVPSLITLNANGEIVFPVIGTDEDVKEFNAFLNSSDERKTLLKETFELTNPGDSHLFIPLDFIMDNFLKSNVAFFKISLSNHEDLAATLQLIPLMSSVLPPYVYFIVATDISVPTEQYSLEVTEANPVDSSHYLDGSIAFLLPLPKIDESLPLFTVYRSVQGLVPDTVYSSDLEVPDAPKVIAGTLRMSPVLGETTARLNHLLFLAFS